MKKGDMATIHNATASGKPIIEGQAVLVSKIGEDYELGERWNVHFLEDDPGYTVPRWVRNKCPLAIR